MSPTERARLAYGAEQVRQILRSLVKGNRATYEAARRVRDALLGPLQYDPDEITLELDVMTPKNRRWKRFRARLEGPEGCMLVRGTKPIWRCNHTHTFATKILRAMGCDVPTSLTFFREHGGFCDCEVLLNVGRDRRPVRRRRRRQRKTT
jgi:hypothetical protein